MPRQSNYGYPPAATTEITAEPVMIQVSRGIQLMFNPIRFAYRGYRNALRNPKYRGWVIGGTLLWLVNLINTVPILGEIDDAIVLTIFAAEVSQMALEGIKQKKAQKELNGIKDAAITSRQAGG